jgi:NADPH2:quinone reductase
MKAIERHETLAVYPKETTVRAIVYAGAGGPEVIELREVEAPRPGRSQVRVRVCATAVNRADLLQRMGMYPAPDGAPKDIPGLEFSGVVDEVGEGASRAWLGQEVCGIAGGGTYAEWVCVHEALLMPKPEGLSLEQAAAIPEAFVTAHDALVTVGGATPGDVVLIHAVGSGVGIAAAQIAVALGARVFGTARTESKRVAAMRFGLEAAFDGARFDEALRDASKGRGADVIVDFVGASYLDRNLSSLAPRGRLVMVGLLGGAVGEINLGLLLRKRARIEGTVLRSRSDQEKGAATRAFEAFSAGRFSSGALVPVIERVFSLEDAAEAQRAMGANENFGKILLRVNAG